MNLVSGGKKVHMAATTPMLAAVFSLAIAFVLAAVAARSMGAAGPMEPTNSRGAAQTRRTKMVFKTLYSFTGGPDGGYSVASLIQDAKGNLYGTTDNGGDSACNYGIGCGVVFRLDPATEREVVLHAFTGVPDGSGPFAGLARDSKGNLYGTTVEGGETGYSGHSGLGDGRGVAFSLDASGKESVLYMFTGADDGANPYAGLIGDGAGSGYGTTSAGGVDACGVVFKLNASGGETVLYSFTCGADGSVPVAGLIRDAEGNVYGTTSGGGAMEDCDGAGCGVVFKLDPNGKETVLHSFTGGSDGAYPGYGRLIRDAQGDLYGTTESGGPGSDGTVFVLDATGKETVLYSFTGGHDGGYPEGGLVLDTTGNLYGTTESGGPGKNGTVYMVDKTGKETVLYSFTGGADGAYPVAGLLLGAKGDLYGTTTGGSQGYGTVFEISP
jgi:uncharacterized repeat protein (TIGR03803 family)